MCEIKVDVNQRFRPANVTPTVQVGAYIRPGKKILNLLWDPWDGTLGTFIITNTNKYSPPANQELGVPETSLSHT